jgi:hypothetical protein
MKQDATAQLLELFPRAGAPAPRVSLTEADVREIAADTTRQVLREEQERAAVLREYSAITSRPIEAYLRSLR